MKYLFTHGHLIADGRREYTDGALLVEDERILDVYPQSDKVSAEGEYQIIDLGGSLVMPGFFDTHTHGIKGLSFDTADKDELDEISREFAKEGSTAYLSTLSYDLTPAAFMAQLERLNDYESSYARYLGVHLEGPFLSEKYPGVGSGKQFLNPDRQLTESFLRANQKIRQMTIAYEKEGAKQIGQLLHDHDIKVMCGHSAAVYEDLDENVDGFTHLFNAMASLHHRDLTLVNCAFMNRWNVELIADGNHVKPNVLRLVLHNIDREKIMLVSDSSPARGLPDGEYVFISKNCRKQGTTFITDDGHFAGSVVSLPDEMRVLYELGARYTDLLLYSSLNAFRFYGLARQFGTLEKGKYADLVIMDDEFHIRNVMVRGGFMYD